MIAPNHSELTDQPLTNRIRDWLENERDDKGTIILISNDNQEHYVTVFRRVGYRTLNGIAQEWFWYIEDSNGVPLVSGPAKKVVLGK